MKNIIALPLLAAAFAFVGVTTASADDQRLQQRLACQQRHSDDNGQAATVAVYANGQGVGSSVNDNQYPNGRLELRQNAHGQTYAAFVAHD